MPRKITSQDKPNHEPPKPVKNEGPNLVKNDPPKNPPKVYFRKNMYSDRLNMYPT